MNCDIRHSIVIAAAPEVVSAALSEPRQLARWWTREVSLADDLVRLDWSRQGWRVELSIDEGADHQLVCWRCHDSNMLDTDAWKGTVMRFELRSISQGTQVDFVQSGYRDSPCRRPARGAGVSFSAAASNAMWKPAKARRRPICRYPSCQRRTRTPRAKGGSGEPQHRSTRCVDHGQQRADLKLGEVSIDPVRVEQEQPTKRLRRLPNGCSRRFASPPAVISRSWPSLRLQVGSDAQRHRRHRVLRYVTGCCNSTICACGADACRAESRQLMPCAVDPSRLRW